MRFCFVLLFFALAAGPIIGFCQPASIRFKHISAEQGLSNSTVECIFQDDRGFIWIGTRDGLNRFDGNRMVVYRYHPADTASISDNYIRCISQDRFGLLWIGTSNGLNRFDPKTGRFTRFKNKAGDNRSLSHNLVTSISQSKTGDLWIGTWSGLNRYQPEKNSFAKFYTANISASIGNQLYCIYEDSDGRLWAGTKGGLFYLDTKKGHLVPGSDNQPLSAVRVIHADANGNFWLGTEDEGLFRFRPQARTWKHYQHQNKDASSLGSNLIRSIETDRMGRLWVGTINGGLNLLKMNGDTFLRYQNEPVNPASLSQRTVSALLEDNQGNLWIGTHRGGLNLYVPSLQDFGLHQKEPNANSLSYNDVKCFFEDKAGKIWIGTDGGGLNEFEPVSRRFTHFRYDAYNPKSLGSDEVLQVTGDSKGNLWVSTWGGGLNLFNPQTGSFTRFQHNRADPTSISSNYVQQVYEDDQQRLWVATYYGGLNVFDPLTKTFRRVESDEQRLTHLMGNNFVSICQDRKGNLWFGTDDGGLNCLERQTQKFVHYFVNEERMPDVRVLFVDSKGRFWAGQTGLYLFDDSKKSFTLFTQSAGLANEFIKGICEDNEGNLWISTSNGLTKFNPQNKAFKKFNTADGLQGLEFEANACLKAQDGQLYFGGVNGFNVFNPKTLQANRFLPPVYITGFYISNQKITPGNTPSVLPVDIGYAKKITLSHTQSTFSFDFAALNFGVPENNQYAYRLRGLNDKWNFVGNENKATYTNLPPGDYVFEVKSSNNDGLWSEAPAAVSVVVTPPFWATWWFRTLVGLALFSAAFFFLFFKRKLELQKIEESKRDEMHRMQLQFFTNISHEFRTPLSLILGPLERLQKEDSTSTFRHHYQTMHRNASRLVGLVNELMDFRKVESGALKLKTMPGNLELFLDEIADEFSVLAEEKAIRFSVRVMENLPQVWFDRQVLEKILINLISNAFKYTPHGGTVSVKATRSLHMLPPSFKNELILKSDFKAADCVFIQVADNGIGISKESINHLFERYYRITDSHLGSGVGLAFVKSLALLHKGSISVFSERHKGTEITIGLPVGKDDYSADERWLQNRTTAGGNIESMEYRYEPPLLSAADDRQASGADTTLAKKQILIVDDNDELRHFLKDSLSAQYQIMEAADGQAGLVAAKEAMPDLIISDVMMPDMDGVEFCRQIRQHPQTSTIPFVMLTAREALAARIEGIDSGADFYFSKPLSINLLLLTIRNIFAQRQQLKDQYIKDQQVETKAKVYSAKDKEFMDELLSVIERELDNPQLDVEFICKKIGMSRTKLYHRIKDATGQSISDFVRTVRLNRAMEIMVKEDVLLTEVMYRVGMQTQSYFTKAFKKEFGKTPSQFLQELRK